MVAPLGVRFVKNARNVRCCRAFFSIREGHGVIMARLAGSGGFFYGSLQTIHLYIFGVVSDRKGRKVECAG